jgi:Na(+)-translocating NADH:ubiquinone oxidoreductase A subunit
MMKVKRRKFPGGYRFRNFAGEPADKLIETGIPDRVVIPLMQGSGGEVPPVVRPGENIKAGQIIGVVDDTISNPVHSTVNGIVEEIKEIAYPEKNAQGIVIKSDGTSDWQTLRSQNTSWEELPGEKIEEILYLSGAASLDREGIPTRHKSSPILPDDVEHIVICGVGSELYSPSLSVLLNGENISGFVEGLRILNKTIPNAKISLALNRHEKSLIRNISPMIAGCNWMDIFSLEPKYPQELDGIIIPTILDKPLPHDCSPSDIGVIVLSIQTVLHVYEAVVKGKPVIERIVALGGTGFRENYHVRLRIGTPLEFLVRDRADGAVRFMLNSPLTGAMLSDLSLPVDRQSTSIIAIPEATTREFLAFVRPGWRRDSYSRTFLSCLPAFQKNCDTNMHGEERPCISCSFCDEVCPVGIVPHLIYKYVERNIISETLLNLKILNCIDCNLCSYVCPSKIPLARFIRTGKDKLAEEGLDI